jgi:hypothetical protein
MHPALDINNVARIGLMYIDGDKLEEALLDKTSVSTDDITYDHECFNDLKISLMRLERINPDLGVTAILWQRRPGNADVVMPAVVGNALPYEGPDYPSANEEMKAVFETGESRRFDRGNGYISYYYAVRNSDELIAGVLELLQCDGAKNDI